MSDLASRLMFMNVVPYSVVVAVLFFILDNDSAAMLADEFGKLIRSEQIALAWEHYFNQGRAVSARLFVAVVVGCLSAFPLLFLFSTGLLIRENIVGTHTSNFSYEQKRAIWVFIPFTLLIWLWLVYFTPSILSQPVAITALPLAIGMISGSSIITGCIAIIATAAFQRLTD